MRQEGARSSTAVPLTLRQLGPLKGVGVYGTREWQVVFFQGWRSRPMRAKQLLEAFARRGMTAVALNPLDPRRGEPSFDRSASLAQEALATLDGPVVLVCHSMGCALAEACQDDVQGIVLCAPPPTPLPESVERQLALATLACQMPPWVKWPTFRLYARRWRAAGYGNFTPADVPLELRSATRLVPAVPFWLQPERIRVPRIAVVNDRDEVFRPADQLAWLAAHGVEAGDVKRVDSAHTPARVAETAALADVVRQFAAPLIRR